MSEEEIGYGITVVGAVTGSIGNIIDAQQPPMQRDALEKTNMASANKWREYGPGLLNPGTSTVQIKYGKSLMSTLFAAIAADPEIWTFTCPDDSYWERTGFITDVSGTGPLGEYMESTITFQWSGEPSWNES